MAILKNWTIDLPLLKQSIAIPNALKISFREYGDIYPMAWFSL